MKPEIRMYGISDLRPLVELIHETKEGVLIIESPLPENFGEVKDYLANAGLAECHLIYLTENCKSKYPVLYLSVCSNPLSN